jgi:signal transduction histidine kinase
MCFLRSIYVGKSQTVSDDQPSQPAPAQPDLPERRRAEEIVEQLRKELSHASRQAGMAEVATGTLHNVGNVLTSITVSASLVGHRLRESRVNNFTKALAMLREHRGDLRRFLADDPKGKMLPGYLETLADHLAAEHEEVLREMDNLSRNLDHVTEIVALQQNYAQVLGVTETLQPSELVEDALRMNLGAFERHHITIIREFSEVPPVTVDKHKVLQIFINLMRNAKYAMDELNPPEKRLTVSIAATGNGRVAVSVRDNGIGIPPDKLPYIFKRGFTTKRDGHGFGLYSGALAAMEMDGELRGTSEGTGKGATFCLELPVARGQTNDRNSGNGHGTGNLARQT